MPLLLCQTKPGHLFPNWLYLLFIISVCLLNKCAIWSWHLTWWVDGENEDSCSLRAVFEPHGKITWPVSWFYTANAFSSSIQNWTNRISESANYQLEIPLSCQLMGDHILSLDPWFYLTDNILFRRHFRYIYRGHWR